jgi:hypothetical protein
MAFIRMAFIKPVGLISLLSVIACSPSLAEQGTAAERDACTPDAFRLCMSSMPDSERVEGCLRAAGPRLSPACYAVFNPPQQQTETTEMPRDRGLRGQRDVQRQPQRDRGSREYEQRYEQPRNNRRDDGSGTNQQREYQSRQPQPQVDDDE